MTLLFSPDLSVYRVWLCLWAVSIFCFYSVLSCTMIFTSISITFIMSVKVVQLLHLRFLRQCIVEIVFQCSASFRGFSTYLIFSFLLQSSGNIWHLITFRKIIAVWIFFHRLLFFLKRITNYVYDTISSRRLALTVYILTFALLLMPVFGPW